MASKKDTEEVTMTDVVDTETATPRIPEVLQLNYMLNDFCKQYLTPCEEIANYNAVVLKKNNSEWDRHKILAQAKLLGRPVDANEKPVDGIREILEQYENAVEALGIIRGELVTVTAEHLGVSLEAVGGERDEAKEEVLKERRQFAHKLSGTLAQMADFWSNPEEANALKEFLKNNPLPVIGRNQTTAVIGDGASIVRYRTKVTVIKEGHVIGEYDGFSKAAAAMSNPVFGYERGKGLTADKFRAAWENAGNAPGKTSQSTVEFEDNNLHFTITAK